jgi:hypothetical protein
MMGLSKLVSTYLTATLTQIKGLTSRADKLNMKKHEEVFMSRSRVVRHGLCIGASVFAIAAFLSSADGAGLPGRGGPAPASAIHAAPAAPMIHSAPSPMVRSGPPIGAGAGLRSFSGLSGRSGTIPRTLAMPHVSAFPHQPAGIGGQHLAMPGTIRPSTTGVTHPVVSNRHLAQHGTTPQTHVAQPNVTPRSRISGQPAASRVEASHNFVTRSLRGVGQASALRNGALALLPNRSAASRALASATFRGRFASLDHGIPNGGWFWRHRRPIIVIGWAGPVFWPYAYWDFIDYTFWPYAYDVFWPYAYDDLYVGVFGPYAYEGPAYSYSGAAPSASRRIATSKTLATTAQVCSAQVPELTGWPIEQIAQTLEPDAAQRAALDGLKDAATMALGVLQSACPSELPSTPTGRLAAMRSRIEAMAQALAIVKPALEQFYDSLSDEQKARFNPIAPTPAAAPARPANRPADLAQVCSGEAAKPVVPSDRIIQALHPTDAQRAALQMLDDASAKAADYLKANCSTEEAFTPPGRVAAMEQRLDAMLEAIKIAQPALEAFYGSLTDEQKARFNQLGQAQS